MWTVYQRVSFISIYLDDEFVNHTMFAEMTLAELNALADRQRRQIEGSSLEKECIL